MPWKPVRWGRSGWGCQNVRGCHNWSRCSNWWGALEPELWATAGVRVPESSGLSIYLILDIVFLGRAGSHRFPPIDKVNDAFTIDLVLNISPRENQESLSKSLAQALTSNFVWRPESASAELAAVTLKLCLITWTSGNRAHSKLGMLGTHSRLGLLGSC